MKVWTNPTLDDWREIVHAMCGEDSDALAMACYQAHIDEETVAVDDEGTLLFDWRD